MARTKEQGGLRGEEAERGRAGPGRGLEGRSYGENRCFL